MSHGILCAEYAVGKLLSPLLIARYLFMCVVDVLRVIVLLEDA